MKFKKNFFIKCAIIASLSCVALPAGSALAMEMSELDTLKKEYIRPTEIPFPKDNPHSQAKEDLGKILYFDPRLSASGTQSCATCHNPSLGWEDGMATGTGHQHKKLDRSSPTILNLAWDELYMWDGRADSLEEQALGPIQAGVEMNMSMIELIKKLNDIKEYAPLFEKAFPEDPQITDKNIGKAIATYERTIVSGEAPFDRWINGDEDAISASAKRGFILFNKKANCAACHSGWNFSDSSFHDIGLDDDDLGRGKLIPHIVPMQHAFKTVGLRNIDRRAPYMHDGSLNTLEEVVDHYDHGFVKRESLSDDIKQLNLTKAEKRDLVEFMRSLTSQDEPVTFPDLPR